MTKIATYIIGTGGLGRGVLETIKIKIRNEANWLLKGFIDDNQEKQGKIINGVKVIGTTDYLSEISSFSNIIIAIASPKSKQHIYEKLKGNKYLFFPNIVHPSVTIGDTVNIGIGNIISENVVFSANVSIQNFNLIHFNSTVGHDVRINNYSSIYPGCNISGYSTLKDKVLMGTNSAILPNIKVQENVTIGAGAVVTKNIPESYTVAGVPAKHLNDLENNEQHI